MKTKQRTDLDENGFSSRNILFKQMTLTDLGSFQTMVKRKTTRKTLLQGGLKLLGLPLLKRQRPQISFKKSKERSGFKFTIGICLIKKRKIAVILI